MNIHAVVDYSFLYYKYKFQLESGRMRRLTTQFDSGDGLEEKDVSQIYYSIREIEGFRRKLEEYGHSATMSICFDMPSMRKEVDEDSTEGEIEAAKQYKANREKRLGDDDFANIALVEELLDDAGYNTYRIDGYEADDIIAHLLDNYKGEFDYNIIYTPDGDLLMHIDDNVGVSRFKSRSGYQSVDMNNFREYLSKENKCDIRYNNLMLFKATVGDRSDNIAGIYRFGPKAFDKLVDYLDRQGVVWEDCGDYNSTMELLEMARGYLDDDQVEQAIESLSLVRPMVIDSNMVRKPTKVSNRDLREKSYMRLDMRSLID